MPTTNPFGVDQRTGWLTYNGQSFTDRYDPRLYGLVGRAVTSGNTAQSTGFGTSFNSEAEAKAWRDSLPEEYRKFFTDPTATVTRGPEDDAGNAQETTTWNVGLSEEGKKYLGGRVQLSGGAGVGSGDAGQGFTEVTQDAIANGRLTYDPVFGVLVDPKDIKGPDTDPSGLFRSENPFVNMLIGASLVGGGALLGNALLPGVAGAGAGAGAGAAATIPESLLGTLPVDATNYAAASTALAPLPEVGTLAGGAATAGGAALPTITDGGLLPYTEGYGLENILSELPNVETSLVDLPSTGNWWDNLGSKLINKLPAIAQAAKLFAKPDQANPYKNALGGGTGGGAGGFGGGRGGGTAEDFQLKKGPNVLTLAEYLAGARK